MRLIETIFMVIGIGVVVAGALVAIYFGLMEIIAWLDERKEKPRCSHCGKVCGKHDDYCRRCGKRLKDE